MATHKLVLSSSSRNLGYVNYIYPSYNDRLEYALTVVPDTTRYEQESYFLRDNRVDELTGVTAGTYSSNPYTGITVNPENRESGLRVKFSFTITIRDSRVLGNSIVVYAAYRRGSSSNFSRYIISPIHLSLEGVGSSGSGSMILPAGCLGCTVWVTALVSTYSASTKTPLIPFITFEELVVETLYE